MRDSGATVVIHGPRLARAASRRRPAGRRQFRAPPCACSPASWPASRFQSVLTGDESLSRRPMGRVMQPLRLMGATIESRQGGLPPLTDPRRSLAVPYATPSGCQRPGEILRSAGRLVCRRHHCGRGENRHPGSHRNRAAASWRHGALRRRLDRGRTRTRTARATLDVSGDLSGAAFFMVAAALVPGSEFLLPGVGLNPRRRALVDYLVEPG